jgi:hypothetical protein
MKILIQDCKTLEFLQRDGARTRNIDNAEDFGSTIAALQYCKNSAWNNLQILMKFARDEFDLVLPISASCKESPARP